MSYGELNEQILKNDGIAGLSLAFRCTFNTHRWAQSWSHTHTVWLFGVFVWRLNFLFRAFSPFIEELNRVHHPPPPSVLSAGCLLPSRAFSQITAALRCPSHMPADQRIYTLTEAQIMQSDLHCCPQQHLSGPVLSLQPPCPPQWFNL